LHRGSRRSRISDVVGRNINRLHRRDRSGLRRSDALLKVTHLGCQCRLITDGARHASEKRGHFGTSLSKAEDVVDEHKDVLVLDVAEIFSDSQTGKSNTQTRSGRLVHLTVNQRDVLENSRFLELEVEIVSFARSLTHTAEHGFSAVTLCNVIDELLNHDGLADTGAAEESDLSTLHEWRDQVDDLDAGLEHFSLRLEVREQRRRAVNRPALHFRPDRRTVIDWLAEHVENSSERCGAYGNLDRRTGVDDFHSANNCVGG
jgi:hypothetical protein